MNKLSILLFFMFTGRVLLAQMNPANMPEYFQQMTESNVAVDDNSINDESSFSNWIKYYSSHPIDINSDEVSLLADVGLVTPLQIKNLIQYRLLLGNIIDINELQAIDNWSLSDIRKVRLYIRVKNNWELNSALSFNLKNIKNSFLLRVSEKNPLPVEFQKDSIGNNNSFAGSPLGISFRYDFNASKKIASGITIDKDPGETVLKKGTRSFDFISSYISYNDSGFLRNLIIGDYTVNIGQGLIHWQSQAFKKSADVLMIKRQGPALKPYKSFGEYNFHRGLALSLGTKKITTTLFVSLRKIDAHINQDSLNNNNEFVSSFYTSGLHRSASEINSKGLEKELLIGGRINYQIKNLHLGFNSLNYIFSLPVRKEKSPYNLFSFSGNRFTNQSIDYSFTKGNKHFFGEIGYSNNHSFGSVNGLLIAVSSKIDCSFFHRMISKKFVSLYANAFTENTMPVNENGLFTGISFKATDRWLINCYLDIYKFPWLSYQKNNPISGIDYLIQGNYSFNKKSKLLIRYKTFKEGADLIFANDNNSRNVEFTQKHDFRLELEMNLNKTVSIKTRMESLFLQQNSNQWESGVLLYFDFRYKPMMKPVSGNFRVLFFDTDSYASRLYAYENDLPFCFSISENSGVGVRYVANISLKIKKNVHLSGKYSHTGSIENNIELLHSENGLINHVNEFKIQVSADF